MSQWQWIGIIAFLVLFTHLISSPLISVSLSSPYHHLTPAVHALPYAYLTFYH